MAVKTIDLEIAEVKQETSEAVSVYFNNNFDYQAGQFITFIVDIDGKEERRCYSLFTPPGGEEKPGVVIKRMPKGKVSNYLADNLKGGEKFNGMEPLGSFTPKIGENSRHYLLMAGGSGITPLMSIMQSVLNKEPESKVTLIYFNRDEESIIFADRIKKLEAENPDRLEVIHSLDNAPKGWKGPKGMQSARSLRKLIKPILKKSDLDTEIFLCGPGGLMQNIEMAVLDLKFPLDKLHKESFTAGVTSPKEVIASSDEKSKVTIILEGEAYDLEVAEDESILFTALDQGVDMPFSCQSGICTACRCKLIRGKVNMETSDGLTPEEIDQGYVLTCVGHPGANEVVLEVD